MPSSVGTDATDVTEASEGPGSETETGSETSSTDSDVGTESESMDSVDTEDTADTEAPGQPLAGGVSLTDIEVNQGVGITVASGGAFLHPDGFVAPVIGRRPALVRATYTLDPEFVPRELEAHLHITTAGTTKTIVDTRMVDGPADPTMLDGTFTWQLDAEALDTGSEIQITLHEIEGTPEPVGTPVAPSLPGDGAADIGVWGEPMVIDLVLVPFSCDGFGSVEISDADLEEFEAYLFNTFPVQAINIEVHGLEYSSSCSEVDAAEFDLPALREAEQAAPYVYYGGLLPGDGGGYSVAIENSDQMDFRRTFANHTWRWYGLTFDLFAHELGHSHGRNHTFEDPQYPLQNQGFCGTRETYGYGLRPGLMPQCGYSNDKDIGIEWISPNEQLVPPTNVDPCDGLPEANRGSWSDMMSYAYPYWVSAYTYKHAAERVRLISSWRNGDAQPPAPVPGVRVVLDGEGKQTSKRVALSGARTGGKHVLAHCDVAGVPQTLPGTLFATHIDHPNGAGRLHAIPQQVVEIRNVAASVDTCRVELPGGEVVDIEVGS